MKNYKKYMVRVIPHNVDFITGILWELDLAGITEYDDFLEVFATEGSDVTKDKIDKLLSGLKKDNAIEVYEITEEEIEDRNWNEEWEKNLNIIEVTDKIVIKPSFREYDAPPGKVVLEINPKMSFGTGEHETTKLVLTMLEKYPAKGAALDVGSGTGILAIAAVKLGAAKAIGIDNDEWCLVNGKENTKLNGVEDKVDIRLTELSGVDEEEFDLVLANINRNILLDIAGEISDKTKKAGKLILSGLLIHDENPVIQKYNDNGFELIEKAAMNEWITLVMRKTD